ncbi:MAG: hypothetical protein HY650_11955 [Acidobacteria bacterium]|nr:hypothetical protein [Acidobacteriota bacterium]
MKSGVMALLLVCACALFCFPVGQTRARAGILSEQGAMYQRMLPELEASDVGFAEVFSTEDLLKTMEQLNQKPSQQYFIELGSAADLRGIKHAIISVFGFEPPEQRIAEDGVTRISGFRFPQPRATVQNYLTSFRRLRSS